MKFNLKKQWWIIALAVIGIILILKGQGFLGALIEGQQPSPTAERILMYEYNGVTPAYLPQDTSDFAQADWEQFNWADNIRLALVGGLTGGDQNAWLGNIGFTPELAAEYSSKLGYVCSLADNQLIALLQNEDPNYDFSIHTACGTRYIYALSSAADHPNPEFWAWCNPYLEIFATDNKGIATAGLVDNAFARLGVDCALPGDVDGDGMITSSDVVHAENMILFKEPTNLCADINGNGMIDSSDILTMENIINNVILPCTIPGDITRDGAITASDVTFMNRMILNKMSPDLCGDMDGNGAVTAADVTIATRWILNKAKQVSVCQEVIFRSEHPVILEYPLCDDPVFTCGTCLDGSGLEVSVECPIAGESIMFSGTVTDADGPVANAVITIGANSITSDENGYYTGLYATINADGTITAVSADESQTGTIAYVAASTDQVVDIVIAAAPVSGGGGGGGGGGGEVVCGSGMKFSYTIGKCVCLTSDMAYNEIEKTCSGGAEAGGFKLEEVKVPSWLWLLLLVLAIIAYYYREDIKKWYKKTF